MYMHGLCYKVPNKDSPRIKHLKRIKQNPCHSLESINIEANILPQLHTVPRVIDFPRYNKKCSRANLYYFLDSAAARENGWAWLLLGIAWLALRMMQPGCADRRSRKSIWPAHAVCLESFKSKPRTCSFSKIVAKERAIASKTYYGANMFGW